MKVRSHVRETLFLFITESGFGRAGEIVFLLPRELFNSGEEGRGREGVGGTLKALQHRLPTHDVLR